jgi:hypothetical protein
MHHGRGYNLRRFDESSERIDDTESFVFGLLHEFTQDRINPVSRGIGDWDGKFPIEWLRRRRAGPCQDAAGDTLGEFQSLLQAGRKGFVVARSGGDAAI